MAAGSTPERCRTSGRRQRFRIPRQFRDYGADQAYRVVGDSLARCGLLDGDLAYVRPRDRVREVVGAHVVARLNRELYLKRLLVGPDGVVVLRSAADGFEPILIAAADDFALLGEVVASVQDWRRPAGAA